MLKNQKNQKTSHKSTWIIRGGRQVCPTPFCLVGILNITPDSFSDGGYHSNIDDVLTHAQQMLNDGAGILDIGAESTRPFSTSVTAEVEHERLIPSFTALKQHLPHAIYSIDTYKASTAKLVLELGADIINDVSACSVEPSLCDILAEYKPGYVLMHNKGRAENIQFGSSKNIIDEILHYFENTMSFLVKAGLPEDRIVLDPGIGFGKTIEHIKIIFQNIERIMVLGRPLYVGVSRKSFFKKIFDLDMEERDKATHISVALLAARGITYHRVHDVLGCAQALHFVKVFTPLPN